MCSLHGLARGLMNELGRLDRPVVLDCEAGLEHFSRGTPRWVEHLWVVLEPYFRSLEIGARAYELGRELGIANVAAIGNKARSPEEETLIREFCERKGLRLAGVVPWDEEVRRAEREGRAVPDGAVSAALRVLMPG